MGNKNVLIYIQPENYYAYRDSYFKYKEYNDILNLELRQKFKEINFIITNNFFNTTDYPIKITIPFSYKDFKEVYTNLHFFKRDKTKPIISSVVNFLSSNLNDEDKIIILTYNTHDSYINYLQSLNYKILKENYGQYNSFILIPFTMNSNTFRRELKAKRLLQYLENIIKDFLCFNILKNKKFYL